MLIVHKLNQTYNGKYWIRTYNYFNRKVLIDIMKYFMFKNNILLSTGTGKRNTKTSYVLQY